MMENLAWWQTLFDQKYLETYLGELTPERTSKEVDFVVRATGLKPEDRVLDLACGHGRHSIELAKRGFSIVGLDYSEVFLQKARKDAEEVGLNIDFIQGDMRNLQLDEQFDVVVMLFTAFGYFDDENNQSTLDQVSKVLKPGGRFLLDVLNFNKVAERFKDGERIQETNAYRLSRVYEMGGMLIHETQSFNLDTQLEHTHREYEVDGTKKEYDFYLKHYTLEQYKDMLKKAGLEFAEVWGDYQGNPQNESNFRALILAHKL